MFQPKTEKIKELVKKYAKTMRQIESIFQGKTRIYIDYANVRSWSKKLGWKINLQQLKEFLDSFDTIEAVNFYYGFLEGDQESERINKEAVNLKYVLRTKPVKIMKSSINVTSIPPDSTSLLDRFISRSLLRKYEIRTIEYLNDRFKDMNKRGEYFIEERKCNFDVEISTDMLLDCERNIAESYVLWSGDSDFADSVKKLILAKKKVFLFATSRRVSRELSWLGKNGLLIFDIQKIREFIS